MVENKRSFSYISSMTVIYSLLIAGGIFIFVPFLWTMSTALLGKTELYMIPRQWIPDPPYWENFKYVFTAIPFAKYYWNTIWITIWNIFGTLLSSSIVAFAFARLQFKARNFLFMLVIATTMIPVQVMIVPRFMLYDAFGWIDTHLPLIIPAFAGEAFGIFLFRQFYMTIPKELDAAAKIDGCGYFSIYAKIIMPLARPVFGIVGVFTFIETWRDFFTPLIYLSSDDLLTISIGLSRFHDGMDVQWNYLMAASMVALLPPLAIFFIGQKYFLEGAVVQTGLKQ